MIILSSLTGLLAVAIWWYRRGALRGKLFLTGVLILRRRPASYLIAAILLLSWC